MLRTVLVIFAFSSCSSKQTLREQKIEIIIEDAQSYTLNLAKQTYTVHSFTRPDTTIYFNLNAKQKEEINRKYYDLEINEFKGSYEIEDDCMIMPKLYTTLKINYGKQVQKFVIDEDCKDYKRKFKATGKKIKSLLVFIREMLNKDPQIRNAPRSDIMYL